MEKSTKNAENLESKTKGIRVDYNGQYEATGGLRQNKKATINAKEGGIRPKGPSPTPLFRRIVGLRGSATAGSGDIHSRRRSLNGGDHAARRKQRQGTAGGGE